MQLSIVVPVYKAESCLHDLYQRLLAALIKITQEFEIVFVEDCGGDKSWEIIRQLHMLDKRVVGIKLSRNFGQHYAIAAGLKRASGEWVVVMDCDLQDRPEEISKLYSKAMAGFDIVLARRLNRNDSFFKRTVSKAFYAMLGYLTDTKQDPTIANFGIYNKKVIGAINGMKESLRYFPVMVRWVGFNSTAIDIEHSSRKYGESTYTLGKLVKLALNVIVSFSDKPLRLTVQLGMGLSGLSLVYALFIALHAVIVGRIVLGWASLFVSIWLLSGLIIFTLGILGLYIGKTFDQTKTRPIYIIDQDTDD
jgi:dolichol-phosphate mannosyltransferase